MDSGTEATTERTDATEVTGCSIDSLNSYCMSDDDYLDMIRKYIIPSVSDWFLIAAYALVFIVGLTGNSLVCYAVWRNRSMHTVTNYFIVNLAVADIMVIIVCLPPTLLSDVTQTWFLGSFMCKVAQYLQTVSVGVSVLTLTAISIERWFAICLPLSPQKSPFLARMAILVTWSASFIIAIPELVVLETFPYKGFPPGSTVIFTNCGPSWSMRRQQIYQFIITVTLYIIPFVLMFVTYLSMAVKLWTTNIPVESGCSRNVSSTRRQGSIMHPNCQVRTIMAMRRKIAKMMMVVVVVFGVCYLPVHLLNILRYHGALGKIGDSVVYFALVAHFLCYFNSAINPVIYNFMSTKFRLEFRKTFKCCSCHTVSAHASEPLVRFRRGLKAKNNGTTSPGDSPNRTQIVLMSLKN